MLAPSQTVACIMCAFQLMLLTPVTRRRKHIFKYALYAGDATLDSLARPERLQTKDELRFPIAHRCVPFVLRISLSGLVWPLFSSVCWRAAFFYLMLCDPRSPALCWGLLLKVTTYRPSRRYVKDDDDLPVSRDTVSVVLLFLYVPWRALRVCVCFTNVVAIGRHERRLILARSVYQCKKKTKVFFAKSSLVRALTSSHSLSLSLTMKVTTICRKMPFRIRNGLSHVIVKRRFGILPSEGEQKKKETN